MSATISNDAEPGTGRDVERDELIDRLERLQDSFERRALSSMAEPLISSPLTMQQLKLLTMIAVDPDRATGHELAQLLNVSVATISGIVDRLVEQGMVRRSEDPNDRRVRRLIVTEEGSEQVRGLVRTAGTMPIQVLRRLPLDDLRALVRGIVALDRVSRELAAEEAP